MTTQHIETLIIGAGQAGLSTGYHLQQLGRPFLIVDGHERIGDNWRHQWDTLKLYSPAKYDGLPGLPFPAPPWSFPGKEQVADYLESYALHSDLPVRMSTRVQRLEPRAGGGFTASLGEDTITCDNVVVATGTFGRTPNVPDFARDLDPSILQLHSSEYRRPDQLAPGRVLVVGASHSGCDIAYEAAEHRPTTLAGRDCGQIPVRWGSRALRYTFPVLSVRVAPRPHAAYAHRPQGDGGDPAPRRPDAARQARRPPPARGGAGDEPGHRRQRGSTRPRTTAASSTRAPSSGAPASGRSSTGSTFRSSVRTATRGSTAASSTRCPACSSAASPSSTRSAPWCSSESAGTPSTSPVGSTRAA